MEKLLRNRPGVCSSTSFFFCGSTFEPSLSLRDLDGSAPVAEFEELGERVRPFVKLVYEFLNVITLKDVLRLEELVVDNGARKEMVLFEEEDG